MILSLYLKLNRRQLWKQTVLNDKLHRMIAGLCQNSGRTAHDNFRLHNYKHYFYIFFFTLLSFQVSTVQFWMCGCDIITGPTSSPTPLYAILSCNVCLRTSYNFIKIAFLTNDYNMYSGAWTWVTRLFIVVVRIIIFINGRSVLNSQYCCYADHLKTYSSNLSIMFKIVNVCSPTFVMYKIGVSKMSWFFLASYCCILTRMVQWLWRCTNSLSGGGILHSVTY